MSEHPMDGPLRDAFGRLRREVELEVPSFAAVVARARATPVRPRPRYARAGAIAATLAATVALIVWLGGRTQAVGPGQRSALVDLSTSRWTAPTDFLLETPGRQLLRSVPSAPVGDPPALNVRGRR